MRTHAQAVVIGGGVIGCSILYHLAKLGMDGGDTMRRRSELTSGSAWHAAANIPGLHDSTNISRLQHYTMGCTRNSKQRPARAAVSSSCSLYLLPDRSARTPVAPAETKARAATR
ncbi:MAG: FAD-dependent oxidoreductase [Nitratireductor sp.]